MRNIEVLSVKDHLIVFIEYSKDDEVTCNTDDGTQGNVVDEELGLYPAPITFFLFGGKYKIFTFNESENKWESFLDALTTVPSGELTSNNKLYFSTSSWGLNSNIAPRGVVQTSDSGGSVILVLPKKREVLEKWFELMGRDNNIYGVSLIDQAADIERDEMKQVFHQERPKKRDANTFSDATFDAIDDEIVFE
jgi:hypothetical protein